MVQDNTERPRPKSARNGRPIDTSSGDSCKNVYVVLDIINQLLVKQYVYGKKLSESY